MQPGPSDVGQHKVASRGGDLPGLGSDRGDGRPVTFMPVCPHCGDLCGRLAQVCASCGHPLYDPANGPVNHLRDLGRRLAGRWNEGQNAAMQAAPPSEAASPRGERGA